MDPRLLLGVGAHSGRTDIRTAHRRLRAAVDPAAGGTIGLADLVDAALQVALTGRNAERLTIDPHALLGVPDSAGEEQVKVAYRRLVRIVHPDLGGTDELFRVVAAASSVLTGVQPPPSWTARPRRPRPSPPPAPPPRGPYRAPAPESRHTTSRWRAWRDLGQHLLVMVTAAVLIAGAVRAGPMVALVAVAVSVAWFGSMRPTIDGALRALVVLRGSRVRVAAAVEPERFLEDTCLDAPVGRQREDVLYAAYVRWCGTRGEPVSQWVFVERLRSLGLLFVKASGWDAGLWVGVTLRR